VTIPHRLRSWTAVRHDLAQDIAPINQLWAAKAVRLSCQYPRLSFDDYLAKQAALGDGEALSVLQSRHEKQQALRFAFLGAASPAAARRAVYTHLKPYVLNNGSVIYFTRDHGKVIDHAHKIYVAQVSTHAVYLALSLSEGRYAGRALKIDGSQSFKAAIVEAAVSTNLDITFEDQTLETQRLVGLEALHREVDPLTRYLERQNERSDQGSATPRHALLSPEIRGPFRFSGLETLDNGSMIALFDKEDARYAKPITLGEGVYFAGLEPGTSIDDPLTPAPQILNQMPRRNR
jgi:hypothetical protein